MADNRSRALNRLAYDVLNKASANATVASGDRILIADVSETDDEIKYSTPSQVVLAAAGGTAGTAVASSPIVLDSNKGIATITSATITTMTGNVIGNVTGAINPSVALTKGAGVAGMETYVSSVHTIGTLITTRILIDLTGLVGSATDTDIIGDSAAASAHMGRITAAINGTIRGGQVTCLEVPAGGTADINFYSANESTGAQDALATSLTETVLIDAGGSWTSGATKGMTALPPANDYLYVANGAASGGTFSAGKFLIELYGT